MVLRILEDVCAIVGKLIWKDARRVCKAGMQDPETRNKLRHHTVPPGSFVVLTDFERSFKKSASHKDFKRCKTDQDECLTSIIPGYIQILLELVS